MEDFIPLAVFALLGGCALLVLLGIALLRLRVKLSELTRRVSDLESQVKVAPVAPAETKRVTPPPLPAFLQPPTAAAPTSAPVPNERSTTARSTSSSPVNWESILGVKFFAWIGGLALFLGVIFFVKYAFERNLVTPTMRVTIGAAIGLALILVSLLPKVRRFTVPAQSLCATGIVILYADIYGAHALYHLIPLTAAAVLMWTTTALALLLASYASAQSMAVLAIIGGFLTPALLEDAPANAVEIFGYVAVLNLAIAGLVAVKRWDYLLLLAALGTFLAEFRWMPVNHETGRNIFLGFIGQFLAIFLALRSAKRRDEYAIASVLVAAIATFAFCVVGADFAPPAFVFIFPILLLTNCAVFVIAVVDRSLSPSRNKALAAIFAGCLVFTCLIEGGWSRHVLTTNQPSVALAWHIAILLLYSATPYFCRTKRVWTWLIAAVAGPAQFWFVYQLVDQCWPNDYEWILPAAFAIPGAIGLIYLVAKEHIDLASGDARLASQGAAVLTFVSLIFPIQFEREWITLGWALEGLALILLFRWIPNRRLRAVALVALTAAFVRLALNPAVLQYHPRTHVPILNWYFYVYGLAALAFLFSARWFGPPREKRYERNAAAYLYTLAGVLVFLLMNIEIADYFSIGPALTFSFEGNFARDMTYTIAWAAFAFVLLLIGIINNVRATRLAAIALLCFALAKLFLHDLDTLSQLYRIAAFFIVAIIAIVASFAYQKFLTPKPRES